MPKQEVLKAAGTDHNLREENLSNRFLLSLVVSPMVEDAVIDLLLEDKGVSGFTSYPINGHGASVHSLSPAEQVSGRQRQILFQTYLQSEQMNALIASLKHSFSGGGIHYWVVPLHAAGRI